MNSDQRDRLDLDGFYFRGLHPGISMGTASDRYGGWLGQIYSEDRYLGRIDRRSRRLGGQTLVSQVLPVDSVAEYFRHFPVLELDFTYYSPLLDGSGKPTRSHTTLAQYAGYIGPEDRILLKVPQVVFARRLWRGRQLVKNPEFLDSDLFVKRFYEPAVALLGASLGGLIFEQEYQKKADRMGVCELAEKLDGFFRRIPHDPRYHVELRTESLLEQPVFQVLAERGVGQVLSHWTWLPSLRKQLQRAGGCFWNRAGEVIVRLLTPANLRYEDAFKQAHPFDRLREEMLSPQLIEETTAIAAAAVARGVHANIIVNNRAAGNAPLLARRLAAAWIRKQRANQRAFHDG